MPLNYITTGENDMANKKGDIGYTVTSWNFHETTIGGAIFDFVKRGELADRVTAQVAIQFVQVHSAGKKVMRLAELIDGEYVKMRGREFDPAMTVYATMAEADAAANALFDRVAPYAADYADHMAQRYADGDYGRYERTDATVAAYRELAARIRDGRCPLELVYK